jgi:hypothetical protein
MMLVARVPIFFMGTDGNRRNHNSILNTILYALSDFELYFICNEIRANLLVTVTCEIQVLDLELNVCELWYLSIENDKDTMCRIYTNT